MNQKSRLAPGSQSAASSILGISQEPEKWCVEPLELTETKYSGKKQQREKGGKGICKEDSEHKQGSWQDVERACAWGLR